MGFAKIWKALTGRPTDGSQHNLPKIRVGVCAMDKKARSKPMKEILERLTLWGGEFEVVIFGDEVIQEKPTSEWPSVDCLLCWHSDGFPLKKAQEYVMYNKPFLVNDVYMQDSLLDRRRVYKLLVEKNIPVPTHIIVERDNLPEGVMHPPGFVEDEDYVELGGQRIYKPFVEKPVSGEDHNIWVYYPHSMGGGVKYLFRKVDDKASKYDCEHDGRVRRDGSYIYEEFLPTGGTDVKVYTVGPRYAHAEARKSPVVDGKVLRSADGKEMRFPVLLSPQEKEIARMVCLAFGQKVCGFDLLRSEKGRSYVCDVNGWSFVKNSKKYYDDAAGILRSIILSALAPHRLSQQPHLPTQRLGLTNPETGSTVVSDDEDDDDALVPGMDVSEVRHTAKRSQKEELRCVLAVIRHGDRTPKQKLKVVVTQEPLLNLFHKYKDPKGKQAKLKSPLQLQELLDITRQLVKDFERRDDEKDGGPGGTALGDEEREAAQEVRGKLRIMQTVLESGGQFSGINRKVQIKPLRYGFIPDGSAGPGNATSGGGVAIQLPCSGSGGMDAAASMDLMGSASGPDSQTGATIHQSSPGNGLSSTPSGGATVLEEALLILKWGGVLTHAGRQQAEDLGKIYRMVMYPSGGNGLLRLHSTYRHDLKIYSSDEGRVQTSAAAFTKAMLDLEGSSLTPILVSLVNKDASMLEAFGKGASDDIAEAKEALYQAMTWDPEKPHTNSKRPHTPMISPPLSPKVSRTPSFVTTGKTSGTITAAAASAAATGRQASSHGMTGEGAISSGPSGSSGLPSQPAMLPVLQRMMDRLQALKAAARMRQAELDKERERDAERERSEAEAAGAQPFARAEDAAPTDQAQSGPAVAKPAGDTIIAGDAAAPGTNPTTRAPGPHTGMPHIPPHRPSPLSKRSMEPFAASSVACAQYTLLRANGDPSIIANLPDTPLGLLRRVVELLKRLEDRLRQLVREEGDKWRGGGGPAKYSSLSMDPKERVHVDGQPCGGEKMLLMFDRWHKLLKSFYNEKKDRFDISKVPDIYDSAKYDAIHNAHLGLDGLEELYIVAKLLADVVIPCEYGLDPDGKVRIGSKIANELLGKLLVDLASMREESMATASMEPHGVRGGSGTPNCGFNYDQVEGDVGRISLQDEAMVKHSMRGGPPSAMSSSRGGAPPGREGDAEGATTGEMEAAETETIHRLCPTYASDINSPLRHVRTRIYFTSESHMHSLVNVLRWCHLGADDSTNSMRPPVTPPSGTGGASSPDLRASAGGGPPNATVFARHGNNYCGPDGACSPMMAAAAAAAAAAAGGVSPYKRQFDNSPLLSEAACAQLDETTELDYLTQVVFRMYENKTVPVESPERFRVEVLFSPGTNYNPFDFNAPLHNTHVLPTVPRTALHKNDGITLAEMEEKLMPYSSTRKFNKCSYALQYSLRAPQLHISNRYGSGANLGQSSGHDGRNTASMAGNDPQAEGAKSLQPAASTTSADA